MLRHFIYLDTEKLYSISSQLFNGFTEEVIAEKGHNESTEETQEMGYVKGKSLGHLYIEATKSIEKKFLHDQAFVVVEENLESQNQVLILNSSIDKIAIDDFSQYPFVKIKAKVQFIDYLSLNKLLDDFNEVGKSLTYLVNQSQFESHAEIKRVINKIGDRNKKAIESAKYAQLPTVEQLALESGLNINPDTLKHIQNIAKFAFTDEFIFNQKLKSLKFNSYVNRSYLREPVSLLLKKYQFSTHKELVVFGVISQFEDSVIENAGKNDFSKFSDAISNLAEIKISLDQNISGLATGEVIIDPIAAYFE
ncbi:hypothetical protein HX127_11365 [Acinetobacter sp. 256-1]|uniref:DUF6414 family protein n=1 Tax=Acinetobacter sp. 256-1 TaxID=2746721 RepID=UPI002577276A|nr:hypothetical protein [Acinetobacter sp. 256-1]MDM1758158.1 hypothetical protein [Acinetobacter sp. 256-1]